MDETPEATKEEENTTAIEEDDATRDGDNASPESSTLAEQSKARSTSFRAASISGKPTSPAPLNADGDTAPEIYRKHVARIEELEKENKRLAKESSDAEKRWTKAENELADLRESESEAKKSTSNDEVEQLVCNLRQSGPPIILIYHTEGTTCLVGAPEFTATATGIAWLIQRPSPIAVGRLATL